MLSKLGSRFSEWVFSTSVRARSRVAGFPDRLREERGAMTIEYILIIALIAIIIITLFTILLWPALRPVLVNLIQRITDAVNGGDIT